MVSKPTVIKVGQRLGNAVMPKFMEAIASHVRTTIFTEGIRKTRENPNG